MHSHKLLPMALTIGLVFTTPLQAQTVSAAEPAQQDAGADNSAALGNIQVIGRRASQTHVERLNRDTITREMIRDNRDLVRYSADVGVAENGRHQKGFAMRGVDDNRVGISIDGVALPDSEENSLYKRYGNFNNSRLRIDPELVRNIEVVKGSDALNFGSGSLGGNVHYRTLGAADILRDNRQFGGMLRSGYSSKNREWTNTLGLGFQNEHVDAALMYSQRRGHETQSRGGDITPWEGSSDQERAKLAEHGMHRIHPDPSRHRNHSYLAKFGWQITPAHRLSLAYSGQRNSNLINELSYEHPTWLTGRGWRDVNDRQKLDNANLAYEYTPDATALATLKADVDYLRTENSTRIYRGQYNYISFGQYGTDRQHTEEFFQRNNHTDFKRLSLYTEFKPFDWVGGEHTVSFKIFGSRRTFENINDDRYLNADGSLENRYGLPNPDLYTIQHPVKTTAYGLVLQDKIRWNDTFSSTVGLRYDHEQFDPQHSSLPCGNATRLGRLCTDAQTQTFRNWSGLLSLDARLNDAWQAGYRLSSGYRNPTASELYFSFESFSGNWFANPRLQAERSLSHNLSLQGHGRYGQLEANLYHTRYRRFLYEREGWVNIRDPYCQPGWSCNLYASVPYQQFHNADRAKVSGLELKGSLNLDSISALPAGWRLSGAVGYSRGSMDSEGRSVKILAIQPLKAVLGLDYEQPDQRWGVFSRLTYLRGKAPKDAQYLQGQRRCVREEFDPWFGTPICREWAADQPTVEQFPWQNRSAVVFDLFGYYKPTKNLTLRAGIYNVFNRQYHSWDTLRGLNLRGTSDRVATLRDSGNHNQGLQRYYAPGRNYAVSLEYKF